MKRQRTSRPVRRRPIKISILTTILSLIVIVAFQNCGQNYSVDSLKNITGLFSVSNSGNGGGYQGKPDGYFVRSLPDVKCDDGPVISTIKVENSVATLMTRDVRDCSIKSEIIDLNEVIYSGLQTQLISYREGVYQSNPSRIPPDPLNFPIGLCRVTHGENFTDQMEVLIQRSESNYFAEIFSQAAFSPTINVVPQFSVAKIASATHLEFSTGAFQLAVDTRAPVDISKGAYIGQMQARIDQKDLKLNVLCQLAGEFDGIIWPSKILLGHNINQSVISSNKTKVYATTNGLIENSLYSVDLQTEMVSPLRSFGQANVSEIALLNDSILSLKGDLQIPNLTEMFGLDLVQKNLNKISYEETEARFGEQQCPPPCLLRSMSSSSLSWNFSVFRRTILSTGPWLIYQDWDEDYHLYSYEALYSYNVETGKRTKLTPALSTDSHVDQFWILPSGQIAYHIRGSFKSGPKHDLFDIGVVNLDGTGFQPLELEQLIAPKGYFFFKSWINSHEDFLMTKKGLYFIATDEKGRFSTKEGTFKLFFVTWDRQLFKEIAIIHRPNNAALSLSKTQLSLEWDNLKSGLPASPWLYSIFDNWVGYADSEGQTLIFPDADAHWQIYNSNTNQVHELSLSSGSQVASIKSFLINGKKVYGVLEFDGVTNKLKMIEADGNILQTHVLASSKNAVTIKETSNPLDVLFLTPEPQGGSTLTRLNVATGQRFEIPNSRINGRHLRGAQISEDGQNLFFMADANLDGKNELYRIGLDGTGVRMINNRFYQYGGVVSFVPLSANKVFFTTELLPGNQFLFLWKASNQ